MDLSSRLDGAPERSVQGRFCMQEAMPIFHVGPSRAGPQGRRRRRAASGVNDPDLASGISGRPPMIRRVLPGPAPVCSRHPPSRQAPPARTLKNAADQRHQPGSPCRTPRALMGRPFGRGLARNELATCRGVGQVQVRRQGVTGLSQKASLDAAVRGRRGHGRGMRPVSICSVRWQKTRRYQPRQTL